MGSVVSPNRKYVLLVGSGPLDGIKRVFGDRIAALLK
jgi:hypothetical protein